jgi:hypothetical protein
MRVLRDGAGDMEERLDACVPRLEVRIGDGPRVSLAGASRIGEVLGRKSWDGAAPVVGQPTRSEVFIELRIRIARRGHAVPSRE